MTRLLFNVRAWGIVACALSLTIVNSLGGLVSDDARRHHHQQHSSGLHGLSHLANKAPNKLELIHTDCESLKRADTFAGYPRHYGHRVHDIIEDIFILLLQALSEKHVSPNLASKSLFIS
jgi:hypothetical protein